MIALAIIFQVLAGICFILVATRSPATVDQKEGLTIGTEYSYVIDTHDGDPFVATAKVLGVKDGFVQYQLTRWLPDAGKAQVKVSSVETFKKYATPVTKQPNPFEVTTNAPGPIAPASP